jgi:hypothetical protein
MHNNSGLQICRVLIGLDMFWSSIPSLQHLGMLLRTCKTIRAECELVFAVAAMGQGKIVPKMWAKRWLGLSMYWMYIGEKHLTLVAALRIVGEHGGLSVTSKRATAYRRKEELERGNKALQRKGKRAPFFERKEDRQRKYRVLDSVHVHRIGHFDLRIAEGVAFTGNHGVTKM